MTTPHEILLPNNATPLERVFSEVNDELVHLAGPYDLIRLADVSPPPGWLPWLCGNMALASSRPSCRTCRSSSPRGSNGSASAGPQRRSRAASPGSAMPRPSKRSRPGIAAGTGSRSSLTASATTTFPTSARSTGSLASRRRSGEVWPGFPGYDIRAAETSYQKTSASLTSDHSGVFLPGIAAKWSFGRPYQHDVELSETELTDLDLWIGPVGDNDLWINADYPWVAADFVWASPAAQARRAAIAAGLRALSAYVRFAGSDDATIGFAKATIRGV